MLTTLTSTAIFGCCWPKTDPQGTSKPIKRGRQTATKDCLKLILDIVIGMNYCFGPPAFVARVDSDREVEEQRYCCCRQPASARADSDRPPGPSAIPARLARYWLCRYVSSGPAGSGPIHDPLACWRQRHRTHIV